MGGLLNRLSGLLAFLYMVSTQSEVFVDMSRSHNPLKTAAWLQRIRSLTISQLQHSFRPAKQQPAIECETVCINKPTAKFRIGIALSPAYPKAAVVQHVTPGSAAAKQRKDGLTEIGVFDRILCVNGVLSESAVHAVTMIRSAVGVISIEVQRCPLRLHKAATVIQRCWNKALSKYSAVLFKPSATSTIGIAFSGDVKCAAVLSTVQRGMAFGVLSSGDVVESVNGQRCDSPEGAAKLLQDATGQVRIRCVRAANVDVQALVAKAQVEDCAICLTGLCCPTEWPAGCGHFFCDSCSALCLRISNLCPLCRSVAPHTLRSSILMQHGFQHTFNTL